MQKLFHIVLFIMSNQFVIMWLCSSCTQVDLSWRYNLYHETRNLNSQSKQNRRNRLKASNSRSLGYWLGILNFDDYPKSLWFYFKILHFTSSGVGRIIFITDNTISKFELRPESMSRHNKNLVLSFLKMTIRQSNQCSSRQCCYRSPTVSLHATHTL